jgi:hypothetical protein
VVDVPQSTAVDVPQLAVVDVTRCHFAAARVRPSCLHFSVSFVPPPGRKRDGDCLPEGLEVLVGDLFMERHLALAAGRSRPSQRPLRSKKERRPAKAEPGEETPAPKARLHALSGFSGGHASWGVDLTRPCGYCGRAPLRVLNFGLSRGVNGAVRFDCFLSGRRGSSKGIRRQGPAADVLWDERQVLATAAAASASSCTCCATDSSHPMPSPLHRVGKDVKIILLFSHREPFEERGGCLEVRADEVTEKP